MIELCLTSSVKDKVYLYSSKKRANGENIRVLFPDLRLDCGCLSNGVFSDERFKYLEMLSTDIWMGNEPFYTKKDWENAQATINDVKKYITSGEDIRIWLPLNPEGICNFLFIVSEIKHYSKIKVIALTDYNLLRLNFENYNEYSNVYTTLSEQNYNRIVDIWIRLSKKHDKLRIYLNGMIVGVDESFYDNFIYQNIPDGEFCALQLIYNLNETIDFGSHDFKIKRICEVLRNSNVSVVGMRDDPQSPLDLYEQIYLKNL